TTLPRSSTYSVQRPLTLSTSGFPYSKAFTDELRHQHQEEQADDEHHAERRELDVLAVLPQLPDEDREHLGARAVEQDRARQLADRDDDDVDPARDQAGLEQRQDDAPEGGGPRSAAHRRRFLQLLVDLEHRGGVVAQAVGHEARDVGDQHDPDRAVDPDRQVQVQDHDREAEHDAGKHHRQRSEVVEQPATAQLGLDHDPADHRGDQHHQRGGGDREQQAVPDRAHQARVAEDGAVGLEREPLQRLHRGHRVELLERRPQQHRERQHHDEEEIQQEDRHREVAPASQVDEPRAEPLAGHRGVAAAARRQARLEVDPGAGDDEQRHRIG